jgi:hypothetical protein
MRMIGGAAGLNALNRGAVPPALAGAGGQQNIVIRPAPVYVKLDSRTIATAVIRYTLQRVARGPSSLSGGLLATGAVGMADLATGGQA